jgi:hypothetical protein
VVTCGTKQQEMPSLELASPICKQLTFLVAAAGVGFVFLPFHNSGLTDYRLF